jgi:SAM-dependent methyltransferase
MTFQGIGICCPACRGDLEPLRDGTNESLTCTACAAHFPIIAGIPDLRVFPDPYIDQEEDRAKGLKVADQLGQLSFAELIDYYYSITSVVPEHHAAVYKRGLLGAEARAEAALTCWRGAVARRASNTTLLEVGCGTGPLLVAASKCNYKVVGVDIAFRWLLVAKKRLEEAGVDAPLICACAEALPFAEDSFDELAMESVLELVTDQNRALEECRRVIRPAGYVFVSTPNRYSVGPDPHTGILAGSWLPERWTATIVRRQGGIPPKRRLLSPRSLMALVNHAGFTTQRVMLPEIPAEQRRHFSKPLNVAVSLYHLAKRLFITRHLLRWIGPSIQLVAVRPDALGQ